MSVSPNFLQGPGSSQEGLNSLTSSDNEDNEDGFKLEGELFLNVH